MAKSRSKRSVRRKTRSLPEAVNDDMRSIDWNDSDPSLGEENSPQPNNSHSPRTKPAPTSPRSPRSRRSKSLSRAFKSVRRRNALTVPEDTQDNGLKDGDGDCNESAHAEESPVAPHRSVSDPLESTIGPPRGEQSLEEDAFVSDCDLARQTGSKGEKGKVRKGKPRSKEKKKYNSEEKSLEMYDSVTESERDDDLRDREGRYERDMGREGQESKDLCRDDNDDRKSGKPSKQDRVKAKKEKDSEKQRRKEEKKKEKERSGKGSTKRRRSRSHSNLSEILPRFSSKKSEKLSTQHNRQSDEENEAEDTVVEFPRSHSHEETSPRIERRKPLLEPPTPQSPILDRARPVPMLRSRSKIIPFVLPEGEITQDHIQEILRREKEKRQSRQYINPLIGNASPSVSIREKKQQSMQSTLALSDGKVSVNRQSDNPETIATKEKGKREDLKGNDNLPKARQQEEEMDEVGTDITLEEKDASQEEGEKNLDENRQEEAPASQILVEEKEDDQEDAEAHNEKVGSAEDTSISPPAKSQDRANSEVAPSDDALISPPANSEDTNNNVAPDAEKGKGKMAAKGENGETVSVDEKTQSTANSTSFSPPSSSLSCANTTNTSSPTSSPEPMQSRRTRMFANPSLSPSMSLPSSAVSRLATDASKMGGPSMPGGAAAFFRQSRMSKRRSMLPQQRFRDSIPPEILVKLSPMELDRQEIIYELIQTEDKYVRDLSLVIDLFLQPLRDNQLLNRTQIATIFSNVESILPVNQNILTELKARQKESHIVECLGDTFVSEGLKFKLYAVYCSNQSHVVRRIKEYSDENEEFAEFLRQRLNNPRCRSMKLEDFLIQPLQRLCKYPLIFQSLIAKTPPEHSDYADLHTAKDLLKEIISQVNERTRKVENVEKLTEIQNRFVGGVDLDIVSAERIYLAEFPVTVERSRKVIKRPCNIIIFSDSMLILKEKKNSEMEIPLMYAGIIDIVVNDLADGLLVTEESNMKELAQITLIGMASFNVQFATAGKRKQFYAVFNKAQAAENQAEMGADRNKENILLLEERRDSFSSARRLSRAGISLLRSSPLSKRGASPSHSGGDRKDTTPTRKRSASVENIQALDQKADQRVSHKTDHKTELSSSDGGKDFPRLLSPRTADISGAHHKKDSPPTEKFSGSPHGDSEAYALRRKDSIRAVLSLREHQMGKRGKLELMEQLLSEEIDMAAKTRTMFMEAVIARTKLENEVRELRQRFCPETLATANRTESSPAVIVNKEARTLTPAATISISSPASSSASPSSTEKFEVPVTSPSSSVPTASPLCTPQTRRKRAVTLVDDDDDDDRDSTIKVNVSAMEVSPAEGKKMRFAADLSETKMIPRCSASIVDPPRLEEKMTEEDQKGRDRKKRSSNKAAMDKGEENSQLNADTKETGIAKKRKDVHLSLRPGSTSDIEDDPQEVEKSCSRTTELSSELKATTQEKIRILDELSLLRARLQAAEVELDHSRKFKELMLEYQSRVNALMKENEKVLDERDSLKTMLIEMKTVAQSSGSVTAWNQISRMLADYEPEVGESTGHVYARIRFFEMVARMRSISGDEPPLSPRGNALHSPRSRQGSSSSIRRDPLPGKAMGRTKSLSSMGKIKGRLCQSTGL